MYSRDSEESAPAEYPPDQPEADRLEDDSNAYGAEEAELEAALVKELEEANKQGEDQEMEGGEGTAGQDDDDVSDAGSEDLEEESEDDDDDLDEDEAEAADGDEDVEMGDDSEQKDESGKPAHQAQPEVMVH